MRKLIVLSSPAGAGKSTWSKAYIEDHPDEDVEIVSSDDTKDELLLESEEYRQMDYKKLYPFVWKRVEEKITAHAEKENATTIMDATSIFNERRIHYVKAHPEYDYFILVLLYKPTEVILAQNKRRRPERIVPEDAIMNMINRFEAPNEEAFVVFNEIVEVTQDKEIRLK